MKEVHADIEQHPHEAGSRTADYSYDLPAQLIAQHPIEPRDASRLLVVDRKNGTIEHRTFADIASIIAPNDALVVNTTRVFRARLRGTREGGGVSEIFLLRKESPSVYEAMVRPGGKMKPGRVVEISDQLSVQILAPTERHTRLVKLISTLSDDEAIERYGNIPLPPYIERQNNENDDSRYQTVFAQTSGSVAAPTAGLHFTPQLLHEIQQRGVKRADILLHVGAGTFKPVQDEDPAQHVMHEEWCSVSEHAAHTINETRKNGGKIWAVGTTSARTLETVADSTGLVHATNTNTNIFIRPPYEFRGVDHLVTNFHLPRSTLIMLVAAFAGYDLTMHAYRTAVDRGYRFYSYGDAMCII